MGAVSMLVLKASKLLGAWVGPGLVVEAVHEVVEPAQLGLGGRLGVHGSDGDAVHGSNGSGARVAWVRLG